MANGPDRHGAAREPLRIAINLGNAALVRIGEHDGTPHGIAVDLAHALGDALGRPVRFVTFPSAGAVMASVGQGEWDAAFLAIDPARADRVPYSRSYLRIEGVFAIRTTSPLRSGDEVDRPGIRVASAAGAAYHAHLSRTLRDADLVAVPTPGDALRLLCEGGCEVTAGVRQAVESFAAGREDLRLLPGRFMTIEQAVAVPLHGALDTGTIDRFFRSIEDNGTLDELLAKTAMLHSKFYL